MHRYLHACAYHMVTGGLVPHTLVVHTFVSLITPTAHNKWSPGSLPTSWRHLAANAACHSRLRLEVHGGGPASVAMIGLAERRSADVRGLPLRALCGLQGRPCQGPVHDCAGEQHSGGRVASCQKGREAISQLPHDGIAQLHNVHTAGLWRCQDCKQNDDSMTCAVSGGVIHRRLEKDKYLLLATPSKQ